MGDGVSSFGDALVAAAPKLLVSARRLVRNEEEARDLVQETLARALRYRERFAEGSNLAAWLQTILRNQHLSQLRHQQTTQRILQTLRPQSACAPAQEDAAMLRDVATALRSLSPALGETLMMIRGEGRTCEEVADVHGCRLGTVKSRLHRANRMMRDALEPRPRRRSGRHTAALAQT